MNNLFRYISICKRLKLDLPLEMKHFVAISLVFFSLTHLAKADQVEGLRLLTEGYCNQQQSAVQKFTQNPNQPNDELSPFFLSYNELAYIGIIQSLQVAKYNAEHQIIADLIVIGKPKNNSP
jgi:hypothetical protein